MYKIIPGIYMITCTKNGDRYIGSSKTMLARKSEHWIMLRKNKHHSKHFQNVWNKYGEDCFVFEILEEVNDTSLLLEREQYWIDKLLPELNKAKKAESGFLGLRHSDETKKRLREIQLKRLESPELIERLRNAAIEQNKRQPNPMKGRTASEETKQKIRLATQKQFSSEDGRMKHHDAMKSWMTDEIRKRISKTKTGTKQSKETVEKKTISLQSVWDKYSDSEREERIEKTKKAVIASKAKRYDGLIAPDGTIYRNIYNLAEFCRIHELSIPQINKVATGKSKSYKGWKNINS